MKILSENWIKWDLNSRSGVKMAAYLEKHGCAGYGYFVMMTEYFYRAEEYKIDAGAMHMYAAACKCMQTDAHEYTCTLLHLGLWKTDDKYIWSERVVKEAQKITEKIEETKQKKRAAANKRWVEIIDKKNARASDVHADAMQVHASAMQTDARRDEIRRDENRLDKMHLLKVDARIPRAREGSEDLIFSDCLKISKGDFEALKIAHDCDEDLIKSCITAANNYLKSKGANAPHNSKSYVSTWIFREKNQFQNREKNAIEKKSQSQKQIDKHAELVRKIQEEEQNAKI